MTLAAEGVSVGFRGERVLRGVSLSVSPGEVVTVVGPSGTGKTTLLRQFALFERPATGRVTWNGEDAWALSAERRLAVRRRTATVFQEPSLFNAPVAENVTYGMRVRAGWSERARWTLGRFAGRSALPDRAERALETVGLQEKAGQNALSLSGGEAQRVAFARALAVDPDVLLLDEPTSNLDPYNTAVLERAIGQARERGLGVLVATHDMHQTRRISDRVAVVLGGELIEQGTPQRIFDSPTDPRTERFVNGELVYEEGVESSTAD